MKILVYLVFMLFTIVVQAQSQTTARTLQFENEKVKVWETIIYPYHNQRLSMHRHDHDRVLVALTDGKLKVVSDKNAIHYLALKKDQAYYLKKDRLDELHSDENVSGHPIKVLVIELQS